MINKSNHGGRYIKDVAMVAFIILIMIIEKRRK